MERNSTCVQFSSIACVLILKRFGHKHNHKARRERWMGNVRMCGEKEMNTKFWSEILKESDYWEKYAWNGSYVHMVYRLYSSGRGRGLVAGSCQQPNVMQLRRPLFSGLTERLPSFSKMTAACSQVHQNHCSCSKEHPCDCTVILQAAVLSGITFSPLSYCT